MTYAENPTWNPESHDPSQLYAGKIALYPLTETGLSPTQEAEVASSLIAGAPENPEANLVQYAVVTTGEDVGFVEVEMVVDAPDERTAIKRLVDKSLDALKAEGLPPPEVQFAYTNVAPKAELDARLQAGEVVSLSDRRYRRDQQAHARFTEDREAYRRAA